MNQTDITRKSGLFLIATGRQILNLAKQFETGAIAEEQMITERKRIGLDLFERMFQARNISEEN